MKRENLWWLVVAALTGLAIAQVWRIERDRSHWAWVAECRQRCAPHDFRAFSRDRRDCQCIEAVHTAYPDGGEGDSQ